MHCDEAKILSEEYSMMHYHRLLKKQKQKKSNVIKRTSFEGHEVRFASLSSNLNGICHVVNRVCHLSRNHHHHHHPSLNREGCWGTTRWFWPDLMNGRHDHTTAVCISLQWSGGLHVVRLPAGSWHRLPHW